MSERFSEVEKELRARPRRFVVTGGAGFIGSHLVETLCTWGQDVVVVDNLATGKRDNIAPFLARGVHFIEADINDPVAMAEACRGASVVLHQAALGSVPRSLADPLASHRANVDGFVTALLAARDAGVARFVYASSSSVYGDEPVLPKVEDRIGEPLSPYAATKRINEIYARVFQNAYSIECVGLRYFNVFGPRQDKNGPYAAVIPKWVGALLDGEVCQINGDGETSRDFCYVNNAVQANLLGALAPSSSTNQVYNVACGERTTLVTLYGLIRDQLAHRRPELAGAEATFGPFRPGDVRHSLADVDKARRLLGYSPTHRVQEWRQ